VSTIQLKPEHKDKIGLHALHIQRHEAKLEEVKTGFEEAKQCMELLAVGWGYLPKGDADKLDPLVVRNAEFMAYFLNDAREKDKQLALHSGIVQALKEALACFLAEHYGLDITKDWQLDLDKFTIVCQE